MNTLLFANITNAWLVAGWTMVHFLWLGAIVAAAAFIARALLRRASPNLRYAVALACLAILAALPLATAAWLLEYSPPLNGGARGGILASIPTRLPATLDVNLPSAHPNQIIELHTPSDASEPVAADQPPSPSSVAGSPITNLAPNSPNAVRPSTLDPRLSTLDACIPYLPWLWLIGTPLTFALLVSGLVGTRRLGRASRPVHDGPIADILARLTVSLHIARRITVAVCDRIAAPVLMGIVRPMILLPPAALTGWSPDEIEMVLLHELAHVRRWDNLINLLQRCLESLLFFHPAVWLISNWARREREACCDAAVVARTNHPHAYAELLVALAAQMPRSVLFRSEPSPSGRGQTSLESSPPGRGQGEGALPNRRTTWSPPSVASAMAAGPLRSRIRRILQLEDDPMLISGKSFTLMLAGVITAATLAIFYLPTIGHAEQSDTDATEKQTDAKIAKQKAQTQNNLRKLAIALQNYHDTKGKLPPHAIYDDRGNQLLSWRVPILPLLGKEALYKEFHLDEPWNSEHNRALIAKMPSVFKDPKINKPGMTNYLAVVGKECGFDGTSKGLGLTAIADGTSKTISIVEADPDLAVEWTKPQDWNFDRAHPTKGLGHLWPDCWYAAWFDGSVRRVENSEPADVIGSQFTRAGREINSLKESAARAVKTPSLTKGSEAMGGVGELRREDAMGGPGEMRASAARRKFLSLEKQKFADSAGDESHEKSQTPTSSEELVFATLPSQSNISQYFQEFAKAFADAEKKHLRLDLVTRDGKQLLIATPQPTEKDWPDVLGAPPRKDRVIAERAWKRLGLKLVPLSSAEVTYRESIATKPLGLLIVGGKVPNGLPLPALLTKMDGAPLQNMDYLLTWLESEHGKTQETVKCYATANGKEYLFDAGPLESTTSVQSATSNQRAEPHEVAPERARATTQHRFPSLEDQKLADLAYKRLGLELEPIGEADLKRVQALGYDGGVKVTAGSAGVTGGGRVGETIQLGDILVGLGVWPTTSMKSVAEILNRGDLAELNPLKFYVVRPGRPHNGPIVSGPEKDTVVTGRVEVQLSGGFDGSSTYRGTRPSTVPADSSATKPRPPVGGAATIGPSYAAPPLVALPGENSPPPLPHSSAEFAQMQSERVQQLVHAAQQNGSSQAHSAASPQSATTLSKPTSEELDVLREHAKIIGQQYKHFEALQKAGKLHGLEMLKLAGYDLALAQGELALAEGRRDAAIEQFQDARKQAEEVLKATQASYDAGRTTYDVLLQATRNLSEIKLKLIHLQHEAKGNSSDDEHGNRSATLRANPFSLPRVESVMPTPSLNDPHYSPPVLANPRKRSESPVAAPAPEPVATPHTMAAPANDLNVVTTARTTPDGRTVYEQHTTPLGSAATPFEAPYNPQVKTASSADKSALRYDGKTFGQWRAAWRTELSTEKRLEAVKALAAFGANGYGKEAAEAILDVAGEYNFDLLKNNDAPESKLEQTILDELAPTWPRTQSMAQYWVPDLAARLAKDPKKWKPLAIKLFGQLDTNDVAAIAALEPLTRSGPADLRAAALQGFVQSSAMRSSDGNHFDNKAEAAIASALKSNEPQLIGVALAMLYSYEPTGGGGTGSGPVKPKLTFQHEVVPLLFHSNEKVRQKARGQLPSLDKKFSPAIVEKVIRVLKNPDQQADRIHAIRALAALSGMGRAAKAVPDLVQIAKTSDDKETVVAAMVALIRGETNWAMLPGGYGAKPQLTWQSLPSLSKIFNEEERKRITKIIGGPEATDIDGQVLIHEDSILFPPEHGSFTNSGGGFF